MRPFLLALALAACTGGETAPSEPDPLNGELPLSLCLDWCLLCKFPSEPSLCLKHCADALTDSTPLCQVEAGARWACWFEVHSRQGCNANPYIDCSKEEFDAYWCIQKNRGCYFFSGDNFCEPPAQYPDPPTCNCIRKCALHQDPHLTAQYFRAKCTSDFTVSHCECYNDTVLVGTCEEGPEPICDVWASCCNQFFDELYPYSAN